MKDMIDYFKTMITPPVEDALVLVAKPSEIAYDEYIQEVLEEGELAPTREPMVHGVILLEEPTDEESKQLLSILKPGGHVVLIPVDPIGYKGVVALEDTGFEVRDAIFVADDPYTFYYTSKASRTEREAGLKSKDGSRANTHPCLHPRADVLTDRGYRPIEDIKIGDNVYTSSGTFHKVEYVSRHPYTSPCLYEISVQGTNYTTLSSDNHPFLIYRPVRKSNAIVGGSVGWVQGCDIRKGDYTMTPVFKEPVEDSPLSQDSYEGWFVFGLWVAEGVLHTSGGGSNRYPSFTINSEKIELIETIKRVYSSVNVSVYEKQGNAVQVVAFCRDKGEEYFRLAGKGAGTKSLDPSIWKLSLSERQAILDGYMAGDGCVIRSYTQAKTVSPDLASQMRLLAHSVGLKANLFRYEGSVGRGIGDRKFKSTLPEHHLRFYSKNLKQARGGGSRKPSRPTIINHEGVDFVLSYIKSVVEVPYVGDVVNLSVEGDPTFQTAVGMSHNTVKPIGIMEWCARDLEPNSKVAEPFMGSGTTGIAMSRLGHDFVGIELNKEYAELSESCIRHWMPIGTEIKSEADVGKAESAQGGQVSILTSSDRRQQYDTLLCCNRRECQESLLEGKGGEPFPRPLQGLLHRELALCIQLR
jgi:hypothetical protein